MQQRRRLVFGQRQTNENAAKLGAEKRGKTGVPLADLIWWTTVEGVVRALPTDSRLVIDTSKFSKLPARKPQYRRSHVKLAKRAEKCDILVEKRCKNSIDRF